MTDSSAPELRAARLVRWLTVPYWSRLDGFMLGVICALAVLRVGWLGWVFGALGTVGLNAGTRLVRAAYNRALHSRESLHPRSRT